MNTIFVIIELGMNFVSAHETKESAEKHLAWIMKNRQIPEHERDEYYYIMPQNLYN